MQWTITYVQNFATDGVHRDAVTLAYPKETPLYTKETHIHYRNVQDSTTDAAHRCSAHIKCMRACTEYVHRLSRTLTITLETRNSHTRESIT